MERCNFLLVMLMMFMLHDMCSAQETEMDDIISSGDNIINIIKKFKEDDIHTSANSITEIFKQTESINLNDIDGIDKNAIDTYKQALTTILNTRKQLDFTKILENNLIERIVGQCDDHMKLLRKIDINNADKRTKKIAIYAMTKLTKMINKIVEDLDETMKTYHKIDMGLKEFGDQMDNQIDIVKKIQEDNFKDIRNLPADLDVLFCKIFDGTFGLLTCRIYESGVLDTNLNNFFVGDKITNDEQCNATIKSMKAVLQRTNNVQQGILDTLQIEKDYTQKLSKLDTVKDIDDMQNFKKDEFISMMERLKQSCKDYQDTVEEKKSEVKDIDVITEKQKNYDLHKMLSNTVDNFTFLYGFVLSIYSDLLIYDISCAKTYPSTLVNCTVVKDIVDNDRNMSYVEDNGYIIPETCVVYDYSRYPREHFNITDVEKREGKKMKFIDGYIIPFNVNTDDYAVDCAEDPEKDNVAKSVDGDIIPFNVNPDDCAVDCAEDPEEDNVAKSVDGDIIPSTENTDDCAEDPEKDNVAKFV